MSLGPFDLTGGPFLLLYGVLLVFTIIVGIAIPRWLRPEGRVPRNPDIDHLAFLAGGASRLAEAVTARLLATKQLAIDGKKFLAGGLGGTTAAERSVLALPQPANWGQIAGAVKRHADPIRERLIADGQLMDGWAALQLRFWQTSPYFLLFAFGWTKLQIGEARGKPVGFLISLLVITAILAVIRFAALDRRTRAGQEVLGEARERSERLRRAPAEGEAGLAVALFGTVVLVGSTFGDFHRMRTSNDGAGGGDSGSSGGGDGGGCGGGGCGGCGGG
ncbi:TIGR04222 domain-containing membrane protein [Sphingomonas psychrotolerans]|uniref:TIGR04222 domain-containing membrane protein n=1 Tax=Sphingomonas psychrotolerans TaxID=1327635 RepID=A0A2K8MCX7_9SPHN|nr:TIGR04222 domain-containing membrane protein [Sphingomonas psychrotolerans]ATY31750.1 TIGR04222 domain-containing membrane protein [Sphingomonas psychrotolerans]